MHIWVEITGIRRFEAGIEIRRFHQYSNCCAVDAGSDIVLQFSRIVGIGLVVFRPSSFCVFFLRLALYCMRLLVQLIDWTPWLGYIGISLRISGIHAECWQSCKQVSAYAPGARLFRIFCNETVFTKFYEEPVNLQFEFPKRIPTVLRLSLRRVCKFTEVRVHQLTFS